MINKNITKIFKRKNKQPGRGFGVYISDPKHAWKIIIYIFIVLNVGIMAFSGYLFLEINRGDIFKIDDNVTVTVDTINRTLLNDTLGAFEVMEIEFEELRKKRPNVIDPSL